MLKLSISLGIIIIHFGKELSKISSVLDGFKRQLIIYIKMVLKIYMKISFINNL